MNISFINKISNINVLNAPKKQSVSFKGMEADTFESTTQNLNPLVRVISSLDEKYLEQIKELARKNNVPIKKLLFHPEICYKKRIRVIPVEARPYLNGLKVTDKAQLTRVMRVIDKITLYTKTKKGVSEEYLTNFIKTLTQCHPVLLQNVIDNNIPIKILDDVCLYEKASHARFEQTNDIVKGAIDSYGLPIMIPNHSKKCICFAELGLGMPITKQGIPQRTYESLPHELAHAFDYYNGTKLGLTPQDFLTINLNIKDNNVRYRLLASFSKEFDKAFFDDYMQMGIKDEENGRKFGDTFTELLNNPSFNYYLGADPDNVAKISEKDIDGKIVHKSKLDDITARKELFAQVLSFATSGYVTDKEFNERIEELFPNCLKFAHEIISKAEKYNKKPHNWGFFI